MAVSVTVATIWLGITLLALLITTAVLTVGRSVFTARRDAKEATLRETLKSAVQAEIDAGSSTVAWADRSLSEAEQRVLMRLLHSYLTILDGAAKDRLAAIAFAVGLDKRARRTIASGTPNRQRAALAFLSAVNADVDPTFLFEHCSDHLTTRVAATRMLLDRADPNPDRLLSFLLEPGQPLPLRGMDVLLELFHRDPGRFLARASDDSSTWNRPLIIQVLTVIGQGFPQQTDEPLAWVIDIALPQTGFVFQASVDLRLAAIRALTPYGWRADLRATLDVERLLNDPSPRIRQAAYELLGAWGDEAAIDQVAEALATERDDRARLRGSEAIYPNRPATGPESSPLTGTLEWVRAEARAVEGRR
mgnify:CR=1 FL=1